MSCRSASDQGLLTFSNSVFDHDGFCNWKKACSMHREATLKLETKSNGITVDAKLSAQLRLDQHHHRNMFMKDFHSIKFLSRQGLPLRGHKEDEHFNGNLYQLLLLQAKSYPKLIS